MLLKHRFLSVLFAACLFLGTANAQSVWTSAGTGIVLSNGNLTADSPFPVQGAAIATNNSRHTGKWYFLVHIDVAEGSATGWHVGAGNGSAPLNRPPGTSASNSIGCYNGNVYRDGLSAGFAGTTFNLAGNYGVVAMDLDANLFWCASLNNLCVVDGAWSGPISANGNPASGLNGISMASVNDGVAVRPMWGADSFISDNRGTLFTSTLVADASLAGFTRWDTGGPSGCGGGPSPGSGQVPQVQIHQ